MCALQGSPTPMVTWLKEESAEDVLWIKPDTKGYKVASSGRQHSLILMDVGSKHAGTYTCIATNKAGQSICTAQFEVEDGEKLNDIPYLVCLFGSPLAVTLQQLLSGIHTKHNTKPTLVCIVLSTDL